MMSDNETKLEEALRALIQAAFPSRYEQDCHHIMMMWRQSGLSIVLNRDGGIEFMEGTHVSTLHST